MGIKRFFRKIIENSNLNQKLDNIAFKQRISKIAESINQPKNKPNKEKFVLFQYAKNHLDYKYNNLGDYVQTIATHSALKRIFKNKKYTFFDRETLSFYPQNATGGGIDTCVMQGWFGFDYYLPNSNLNAVYIGTHFTNFNENIKFLQNIMTFCPQIFDTEFGCRDKFTLDFLKNYKIKSYFSRCLTLTLPKRKPKNSQNKVFFVNIDENLLKYFPKNLLENAEFINQKNVENASYKSQSAIFKQTFKLLNRYKNEAKLIITNALHCASPATAFGIPVILLCVNEENKQRFSALDGILPIYTIEELKNQKVNFSPKTPNIEPLKEAMLENLRLSVLQSWGEKIDENALLKCRKEIAEFNCLKTQSNGGGF